VTAPVRRALGFALVGALALVVPLVAGLEPPWLATAAAIAPFVAIAALALSVVDDGPLFELFARPGDREDDTLYGLAGFALSIAGLSLLALQFGLPMWVFVASVLVLAGGNLGARLVEDVSADPVFATAGFVTLGFLSGAAGGALAALLVGESLTTQFLALLAFYAVSGALLSALLRAVLFERDDPLVLFSIALLLWLLADLDLAGVTPVDIALALAVTVALGYVSYALETASLPGMLTGVFLGLLTIVLGDFRWFAMLITFFGLGGLSTKFRYEEKLARGIAEENEGARGSGNVLANSIVALVAVVAAAASPEYTSVDSMVMLYAFAGAVAAAMSDTFSSEFGGLYDSPRLITTLERVEPGTDGGVTWQGAVAGVVGAGIIAGIAGGLFESVGAAGALVVLGAGFLGMLVDSALGATIEGGVVGNQSVNLLATLAAAIAGGLAFFLVA
jgi:uncharacterized protein (TIGR00297 family)